MTLDPPGTSLARRLGLKPGTRCWFQNMPDSVRAAIAPETLPVEEQPTASDGLQHAHLFATDAARLGRDLAALRQLVTANGVIWVSWPAQGDGALSETTVRVLADAHDLVPVEICALDDQWLGLKLKVAR
jgi:hypothetical protein